ncbi:glycosyltransferase family 2 protein [Flavobacterium sp. 7A]|uniref:glycosyltransferase family 2 protein n=1 Tax=Flavobacterium sp. 7A TaxID=2940571 RepID=UPI0022263FF2|nr:glycosyltransferase family 2 protein [Flavobacterium sp. 7A]MCW2119459.1 GT2 family glycosyltransferase [Flavobacterium sp. 7A]
MKFSLVVCTYMRPQAVLQLLQSVQLQTLYPNEILIIDGSPSDDTKIIFDNNHFENLVYRKVSPEFRGLTKQRNFGVQNVSASSEIICFLDDDTVLKSQYFFEIIEVFKHNPEYIGVGGISINDYLWQTKKPDVNYDKNKFYEFEGYVYPEGLRNVVRNKLGLSSDLGPSRMPAFSHGRTCGFPLNDKIYEVDLLIGMSMSFRAKLFKEISFSTYFEGYGLYEDADFSLRALNYGQNAISTKAQLYHNHEPSGRPNQYHYGKMVVRNGWYVWRVKNPSPTLKAKLKWHSITIVLMLIRYSNVVTTKTKKEAFTEAIGRTVGWWSLLFNKPKTII